MDNSGARWFVSSDGKVIGPVSTDLLARGISAGRVPGDALVCREDQKTWIPIGEAGFVVEDEAADWGDDNAKYGDDDDEATVAFATLGRSPLQETAPGTASERYEHRVPAGPVWYVRRRGEIGGPYDEATIGTWLRSGVQDFMICAPGGNWLPLQAHPELARVAASTDRGPPPTDEIVMLLLAWLVAIVVVLGGIWWPAILVATGTLVYADARSCGIRKGTTTGLFNMSPLGWAVSVMLFLVVGLPAYALARSSARTRPGNPAPLVLAFMSTGLLLVVLALSMLRTATASQSAPRLRSGEATGVAACDAYLGRMAACFNAPEYFWNDPTTRATVANIRFNARNSPADRATVEQVCRDAPSELHTACPTGAPRWTRLASIEICNSLAPACPGPP